MVNSKPQGRYNCRNILNINILKSVKSVKCMDHEVCKDWDIIGYYSGYPKELSDGTPNGESQKELFDEIPNGNSQKTV